MVSKLQPDQITYPGNALPGEQFHYASKPCIIELVGWHSATPREVWLAKPYFTRNPRSVS